MAEPWPVSNTRFCGTDRWAVDNGDETVYWNEDSAARHYAALPVLLATIRDGCERPCCAFCGEDVGHHNCPGIAALKAAGEEIE